MTASTNFEPQLIAQSDVVNEYLSWCYVQLRIRWDEKKKILHDTEAAASLLVLNFAHMGLSHSVWCCFDMRDSAVKGRFMSSAATLI